MTTPQDEFIASIERSRALLDQLRAQLDDFLGVDPDNVNYAHVGDAGRIENILECLASEYAAEKSA